VKLLPPATLTARLALLFAAATIVTFSVVGGYLYRSLAVQLELRDDHELIGKIEQFRHILLETASVQDIRNDQHRFIDAAAGHDGLIVILKSADDRVLIRNQSGANGLPDIPIVPANQRPDRQSLKLWTWSPDKSARTVSAWGELGKSSEQVQIIVARTESDRMALLEEYRREVLGAMLAGAILAVLLGYAVVRGALRPVKAIAQQAHSITAQRLEQRMDARAVPAELQTLVQSFNAVLDRLQDSFQRLSQFSADLAHDLRTPLYNLTMQTEVALSQQRCGHEYQALLSSSLEEYERLARMVDSMLFLARADNAQVALAKQRLDVADELQRIADYFEGIAEDAGVQLMVQGEGAITADAALFRRAVNNLVANAIRYTPRGAVIRLCAAQAADCSVVSVINPGIGINAEHVPRIFDRFYRADQARSQSASATGLGLAIVQSIMKLHGGRAEVDSIPHGQTTFRLVFPAQQMQAA
jgi:two-component system heavy metal sensor histidine kinase CusS